MKSPEAMNPILQSQLYAQLTNAYPSAISEIFYANAFLAAGDCIQPAAGV